MNIKLSIGILVSNRKQYIREVMEALRPLLLHIPSELIAVDTKGEETDGSIEIVKEYTDKIYPFTWCNDFAAARNVCLDHAVGEWFLFLDDDEVFDDVQEIIQFFQSGEYKQYGAGYYHVRNYSANGSYSISVVGRMIRRKPSTRFVGKVHESFNEVEEPFKLFSSFVHHYGYVFTDEEQKRRHQERNVGILRQELNTEGMTPRVCAQMMQELLGRKETADTGFRFFEISIKELEKKQELADSCVQWMLVASVRYFKVKKDYPGLLTQAEKIRKTYFLNQVAKMALAGVVIESSAPEGNVRAILDYAPLYREGWEWMQKHPEEAIPQRQLDFSKYLTKEYAEQIFGAEQQCLEAMAQQKKKPELIHSDMKLTIGMLVSNHVQYIRKAMEALQPLLQAVPSELVVIDTKGAETDGSIEIVKEYTDKIYPFTWCNDFSAARNFCLSHAKGEWFLYVDDDEWFDDVQEFIDFFQTGESEQYYSGFYYTRDYVADGSYSMGIAGRMIRRTVNTCFVGKVHETFNEVFAPNKLFSCFTHHMGYVYEDMEARKKHQQRNLSILQEELDEKGCQPGICAQIVQEMMSVPETRKEGYEFAKLAVQMLKKQNQMQESCSQWILTALVRYFADNKEYQNMLQCAKEIQKEYSLTQMALLALSAVVMKEAEEKEDNEVAQDYASFYLEQWKWLKNNEEDALLQMQMDFPRYYTEEYYRLAEEIKTEIP